MLQQCGLPAAEGACKEEKTILAHIKTVLSGMASHAIAMMVSLRFETIFVASSAFGQSETKGWTFLLDVMSHF